MKLWVSTARPAYGDECGVVAVVAATREQAIAKARAKLKPVTAGSGYVPAQQYAQALLDGLTQIREAEDEVFIDWSPSRRQ
jgi:hypothetical protein